MNLPEMLASATQLDLKLSQIHEPHQALRGPQRHDTGYVDLTESVRERGVLLPVIVRPDGDVYILIDGMQRLAASKEVGWETIPARVLAVSETEALEIQIILNLHRVETTPVQYAAQVKRLISLTPGLTVPKLSRRLNKSPTWVYHLLDLLDLDPKVVRLVEEGKIVVANAQALAKLPKKIQVEYLPLALDQQPQQFIPKMTAVARQCKEGFRESRGPKEYIHVDRFQRMSAVRSEIEKSEARAALFAEGGRPTPERAWQLALEWVLHRDPISVRQSKTKEQRLLSKRAAKRKELEDEAKARRGE